MGSLSTYEDSLSPCKLPPANLVAARDTEIKFLEGGTTAAARLRLSISTGACRDITHGARAVITPGAENVGGGVANVGLREAGHKSRRSLAVALDRLLHEVRCYTFVVAGYMGVVLEHGCGVDWEPRQDADILQVRCSTEPQQGHGLVDRVRVLSPLGSRICEVRNQTPAEVGVCDVGCAKVEISLGVLVVVIKIFGG